MRFNILNHRYSVYDEENFGERYYFSEAKTVINHKGVITAGTENGIFYFNTASIRYGDKAPYITISGLQYQGENFIHPVNDINELTLTPQQRSLTIFLSTPNKSEMTKTSFAYILEGYDKKWNYIINGNAISYGNLPPGTYSLKICVSNAEGKWENNIRKITVVVKPMFTETVWFFILIALLVIVCISGIGYVTYYIKRLRARQSQLLEYIEQNMRKQENDKPSGTVTPQFTPPSMPDHDKEFLDKFTEIFLANICNSDMSIDDFATELGMSHAVFYRKIKQLVGVTPVDFIRRLRVKRAIQYFDVGERQIADVAYKTGFSDPKYFSRCFKSETGCSPSEYCQQKDETK
jgi:AraC-like DNA-binding protein